MHHRYFTSESVLPGHPDKLCDQISDAILDELLKRDRMARVAVNTIVTKGVCHIFGEVTTRAKADYESVARNVMKEAGYTNEKYGMNYRTCEVYVDVHEQSSDIAKGVVKKETGAGDQGFMVGYAVNHTKELMPAPIMLAHALARRAYTARLKGALPYLRPDGKVQVTMELENGIPFRVDSVVMALQHDANVAQEKVMHDAIKYIIVPAIGQFIDSNTDVYVNNTGRFIIGGPAADSGLTGKKTGVDTYGGWARHGGGCFSGKDATKVDRSAAYMARFVAKNIVAQNFADEIEIEAGYVIGKAAPVCVSFDTNGTEHVPIVKIQKVIDNISFKLGDMIKLLDLRKPVYRKTAAFGHFGRGEFAWEQIKPKMFKRKV